MKPMLEAISDGNKYTIKSLERILAYKEKITEQELQEMLPSGTQTVFKNRIGWAKTYLKKAGLIDSPARATIEITDAGRQVLKDNPDKIDIAYLNRFPSFHAPTIRLWVTEDLATSQDLLPPSLLKL